MQSFCQRCTPRISSTYECQNISPKLRKVITRGIARLSIRPSLETIHFFYQVGAGSRWDLRRGGGGHAKKNMASKAGRRKTLGVKGESLKNSFNFCSDGIGDIAKSLPRLSCSKHG